MKDRLADAREMRRRQSAIATRRPDILSAIPFDQFSRDRILFFDEDGIQGDQAAAGSRRRSQKADEIGGFVIVEMMKDPGQQRDIEGLVSGKILPAEAAGDELPLIAEAGARAMDIFRA